MNWLGQCIAFAALVAAATVLEINGKFAQGLWLLVVVWAFSTDLHPKQKDNNDKEG